MEVEQNNNPSISKGKQIISISQIETPLGKMFACAIEQGICLLEFTDRRELEKQFKTLTGILKATFIQGSSANIDIVQKQLNEYFEGKRKEFSVPLITPGTEFQQSVWKELKRIPYGSTRSYKQQSIALNKPEAVRAIAHANGLNRIAIIIPCHRVIGEDGNLTGYSGGLWRKKWLIDFEKANYNQYLK